MSAHLTAMICSGRLPMSALTVKTDSATENPVIVPVNPMVATGFPPALPVVLSVPFRLLIFLIWHFNAVLDFFLIKLYLIKPVNTNLIVLACNLISFFVLLHRFNYKNNENEKSNFSSRSGLLRRCGIGRNHHDHLLLNESSKRRCKSSPWRNDAHLRPNHHALRIQREACSRAGFRGAIAVFNASDEDNTHSRGCIGSRPRHADVAEQSGERRVRRDGVAGR